MAIATVEALAATKRYSYFRPSTVEQRVAGLDTSVPVEIRNNPFFKGLVNQLIEPFKLISVFEDGGQPYSPADGKHLDQFRAEMEEVVYRYTRDFGDVNPKTLTGERKQTWLNMVELSPQILQVFTDPKNHIGLVQKREALNLAGTALHLVRFPDTQLALTVGFGGTDDEWTAARFNAYAISPTNIRDDLRTIIDKRRAKALDKASVNKAFDEYKKAVGGKDLEKDEKRRVVASIPKYENGQPANLTEDEKVDAYRQFGIPLSLPQIKFFFAYHPALAINQTMDGGRIRLRADEQIDSLKKYVATYHPQASESAVYLVDKPWENHSPLTRLGLKYLVSLLRDCPDEAVQKELVDLKKIGRNKGGEIGEARAEEYIALHPPIFSDRLDMPHLGLLEGDEVNPEINITIGGRTERTFCAARIYLAEAASAEGFESFVLDPEKRGIEDEEIVNEVLSKIRSWKDQAEIARQARTSSRLATLDVPSYDYPIHGISLITDIASGNPPYYVTEYDKPLGTDLKTHLAELELLRTQLQNCDFVKKTVLEGTIYDLKALIEDMRRNAPTLLVQ